MSVNILKDMLLISDPSVFKLYKELIVIAGYFIAPVFTVALVIEYLGEMNFAGVLKKLLIIVVFMGAFYNVHTKAVDISLVTASKTLKRISPRNLFVKKWFNVKVRTKKKSSWSSLEAFAIPNLNDLVATSFFVLSKVFIWLLKLIYSSVYHLTYIFAGFTAIMYFLGWTKDALKGTIQASLWCMILPFVIVAILGLVGNSMDNSAAVGEVAFASINNLIWLFGVTLLLLISPLITYGMIKGDGIHSAGAKMGSMMVSSGTHALSMLPMITRFGQSSKRTFSRGKNGLNKATRSIKQLRDSKSQSSSKLSNLKNNRFASSDQKLKLKTKESTLKNQKTQTSATSKFNTQKRSHRIESKSSKSEQRSNIAKNSKEKLSDKRMESKVKNSNRSVSKNTLDKKMIKSRSTKELINKRNRGGKRELR